jgi:hypothetical protein
MPKKVRELKSRLRKAGFTCRPGKGNHTVWSHPKLRGSITLSGNDGDDARRYHEERVERAIAQVEANP